MRDRLYIDRLIAAIWFKYYQNEFKGSWKDYTDDECDKLLQDEIQELDDSVLKGDFDNAILEAADVALCAAFKADSDRRN